MTRIELKEKCSKYLMSNFSSARNLSGDTIPVVVSNSVLEKTLTPLTVYEVCGITKCCTRIYHSTNMYYSKVLNTDSLEVIVEKTDDMDDIDFIYVEQLILSKDVDKNSVSNTLNQTAENILNKIHTGIIYNCNKLTDIPNEKVDAYELKYKITEFIVFRDNFAIDDEKNYLYRICMPMKVEGKVVR